MGKSQWRFIPLIDAPGQFQMALDWWILQQHRLGKSPPVLRFYTWSIPTLSLGYHQKRYPRAWENLVWQGNKVPLIRRPSGGRAVLHQGDLTYMVVTSGLGGDRSAVYQHICEFLVLGWRALGVNLTYGEAQRGYMSNPNCFETATGADLIDPEGQKLIGSAQLRQGKAILQHGSMIMAPDVGLYNQVFGQVFGETLSKTRLYRSFSQETVIRVLTEAAKICFEVDLITKPLLAEEFQQIKEIELKFLNDPIGLNTSSD